MNPGLVRIATRKSPLALWQAEHVSGLLRAAHPGLRVELVTMSTQGDKILDSPLAKVGGKGLFVKELENSLLAGETDIAVHSMKDVPVELPEGLHLPVVLEREDPRDAFLSTRHATFAALPPGARVGTSSLRRQCQLLARRQDLEILSLRGNVNTRLRKLDEGEFDAIILACAGVKRMGWGPRITETLAVTDSLPAIGQGAIGIECRERDERIHDLIRTLEHRQTHTCVRAERAMNHRLQGGCQVPIAGHATLAGGQLTLHGLVGSPDGRTLIRGQVEGPAAEAERLGVQLADDLLARGAGPILRAVYAQGG